MTLESSIWARLLSSSLRRRKTSNGAFTNVRKSNTESEWPDNENPLRFTESPSTGEAVGSWHGRTINTELIKLIKMVKVGRRAEESLKTDGFFERTADCTSGRRGPFLNPLPAI